MMQREIEEIQNIESKNKSYSNINNITNEKKESDWDNDIINTNKINMQDI
jgi:hypothetical protein